MSSRFHRTEFDFLPELAFRKRGRRIATLEGGGGGMPPPDPALVQAQVKSLGVQDDAIQQIIQNANDMAPLQKQQLQLGIQAAQTAYDQSQQDRTFALGRRDQLVKVQQPLIDQAENFNEGDRRADLMQQANADIGSAFSTAQGQQSRAMQRLGVNPASGAYRSMQNESNIGEAIARAEAGRKVTEAARQEGLDLRTNASNMLNGYPAMASNSTGLGFQYGTAGSGIANQGLAGLNSGYGQASAVAGQEGQSATNMWNAQANAYANSQNAQGSQTGAIIGGVATVAAAFI